MDQSITGSMIIAEHECPFSYTKETEKIIVYTGNKGISIPDGLDILVGQKFGMLSGGNVLYKLSVPLSNDTMTFVGNSPKRVSCSNQIRSVEYYIEDYCENSKYGEMRLQFPELNYFFASVDRATIMDKQVVFSREKKTLCSFDFRYHDTDVNISFVTKIDCHSRVKTTAETISEISLVFPETDDLEFVGGLYEVVRCFFSFVCNRRNIGLRSAVLVGAYPIKRIEDGKVVDASGFTAPTMFFSQKYLEPEEDKKVISKTPNWDLFSEKIPELFRLFSEDAVDSIAIVNGNGIHHSVKYRNLIDLELSLHITATFECYVRTLLPEMSSASTIAFIEDLQLLLDEYIEKTSGKKKQKAKGFKKGLSPQIALEDKLRKVYDGYPSWEPLKPVLCEWFGEDISGLASAANLWRNELAHEKREYQPGIEVVNAIRLVEHLNYCIVLRHAGYSDDQIKAIIKEILIR